VVVAQALLEALDRFAEVLARTAQALGAEDQQHDHQHDDPMPDAETAHCALSGVGGAQDSAPRRKGMVRKVMPVQGSGSMLAGFSSTGWNGSGLASSAGAGCVAAGAGTGVLAAAVDDGAVPPRAARAIAVASSRRSRKSTTAL